MPAHPTSDKPKSLPRLRFSLRTLLLCVLSLASLATLWWNWGPWQVAFSVTEPQRIQDVSVSSDDRFLLISCGNNNNSIQYVDIRRLPGGERHTEINFKNPGRVASVGRYFAIYEYDNAKKYKRHVLKMLDAETLQSLGHEDLLNGRYEQHNCAILPKFAYRTAERDYAVSIYRLPDFAPVVTLNSTTIMPNHPHDVERLACYHNGQLEIVNLQTGKTMATEKVDVKIDGVDFSPTTMIGYPFRPHGVPTHYIFSLTNGKLLMKADEYRGTTVFTPDGTRYVTKTEHGIEMRDVFSGALLATQKINSVKNLFFTIGEFSPDGTLWKDELSNEIRDGRTLQSLWKPKHLPVFFSHDSNYLVLDFPWKIHQARTGESLMDFSSLRWRYFAPSDSGINHNSMDFSHHSSDFWIHQDEQNRVTYFHMTRPPTWLSILSKPELWLAFVLCTAFIRSIWRGIK